FENRQRTRTLAMFGQEELLLLDERLFVSGGVLVQKSTNNADVNKLFSYPKVAASFRWPTLGPFEEVKVRVAYGQTGNEPLYGQKFASLCGTTYTGQNALAIQAPCNVVADPTLHPERNREIEAGIDAGLFNSPLAVPAFTPPSNFGFSYGAGFIDDSTSPSQVRGRDGKGGLATMGDYEPKFTMGFSTDITYKSFRLYGLLDWRHGGAVVNVTQN